MKYLTDYAPVEDHSVFQEEMRAIIGSDDTVEYNFSVIASETDTARSNIISAIQDKGGTVAASAPLLSCANAIRNTQNNGTFYKCASVNTENTTWTGYQLIFNKSKYIYSVAKTLTEGLPYCGFVPEAEKIYNADTTILIADYMKPGEIPTEGLVLHASLNGDTISTAETGQSIIDLYYIDPDIYPDFTPYMTVDGVDCFYTDFNNFYATITVGSENVPHSGAPISFSLWFKAHSTSDMDSHALFSFGDMGGTGNTAIELYLYKSRHILEVLYSDDIVEIPLPESFDITKWHHYVLTYDSGGNTMIYFDGVVIHTYNAVTNIQGTDEYNSYPIYVGAGADNCAGSNGYFAAFRIYDHVLSQENINALSAEFFPTDN